MKDLLTAEGLVAHMENKGITFNRISKEDAQSFLENNNYYMKLASYRANYKKYPTGPKADQYIGLDFSCLQELSKLDMRIRYLAFQMALDIEHFMKVQLLNNIEKNSEEDGYKIIQKFIANDHSFGILKTIRSHKASAYCKDLIEKYYPYFPAWVFVELISFGDFAYLCELYNETYGVEIGNRILLNSVRDIRNACAHSNCLINNLAPGNNKAHQSVVDRVKTVASISENSRDKKLSNKCIYDFVCLLYAYDEIVSSPVAKQKRYDELEEFFEGRMIQNKDWFRNNNIITSSYSFVKKVLDSIAGR
jgi:abortive infection bacteriophage resistance protein